MSQMNKEALKDVIERAEAWPERDQAELVSYASEIEARRNEFHYATDEDLRKISEAREAVRRGEIATDEEVRAVFAKHRRT
jgi:hypothetical protein